MRVTKSRALAVLAVAASLAACGEDVDETNLVASVGDHRLTVDQVVALLQDEERLPPEAGVVESLVELWIDYTLLTEAVADDSTFADLDLETMVRMRADQEMIFQLRDSVIQVDTAITPETLRDLYAAESPSVEVRARHIMMTFPLEATAAQRDSVRRELEAVRARIAAGEGFESLAAAVSQDPGSARSGGDLGYFGRGDMVRPFEEAAMALEPGEVSEVVETPMGLHLIRVDDRRIPDFDEIAPQFRAQVQAQRNAAAESTFVSELETRWSMRLADGALAIARELARDPGTRLSRRAAGRALVQSARGGYSVRQLQLLFQFEEPSLRVTVAEATDEQLEDFLLDLGRRHLLVEEARAAGLEPSRARVDSLVTAVRGQLVTATRTLGLWPLDQAPGERRDPAVQRAVRQALADNLSGATRIVPLGLIGFQLREGLPISVYPTGVGESLLRIAQVRARRSPSPLEQGLDSTAVAPDSVSP